MDGITLAFTFLIAAVLPTYFLRGDVRNTSGRSTTRLPRRSRAALVAIATNALILPALTIPSLALGPESIADVAEQVVDAVVGVSTSPRVRPTRNVQERPPSTNNDELFTDFFDRRGSQGRSNQGRDAPRRLVSSLGAGFIIDAQGIVVTNNSVVADAGEITVILKGGSTARAELIGADKKLDLAVLKIDTDRKLKAVKFGDSDKVRSGEWVFAIGSPFGLGGSVTAGIISAQHRDINSGPYDNYLQTDTALNPGNAGGPLFNLEGDVVGIITAITSPSGGSVGIGFAVPSKTALATIDQLKQFGAAQRGWLGVRMQDVTDEVAERLGMKPARGALIVGVDEKGPAKPAGIEPDDVIIKFDGKEIKQMRDLPRAVAETPVGKQVNVLIIRKGKEETKIVTIGRLEN
jgi:serine protease Do